MKEILTRIWLRVLEDTPMKIKFIIRDIGSTINNMEKAWRYGPMEQNMKEIFLKGKSKVKESIHSLIGLITTENFMIMNYMVKAFIITAMEKITVDSGIKAE